MLHKIISGEVSINPRPGTLTEVTRSTRAQQEYIVPHTRINVLLYSFFPETIRMWNSLPDEAKSASSVDAFRTAIEGWKYVPKVQRS